MQDRQKTPKEIAAEAAHAAHTHNRQLPLFTPDPHVREENVYRNVTRGVLFQFSETCQQAAMETRFQRLLHAAVGAEPESYKLEEDGSYKQKDATSLAAIAFLKRQPEYLFKKGMVTDHFGRRIFASPYQLFHGAGDVWALKQVHEEIIPKIERGEARARAQYIEQFPNPFCALSDFTDEDLAVLQSLEVENEELQVKI